MGGEPGFTNIIEYVTFSTTGNATNFGDLSSRLQSEQEVVPQIVFVDFMVDQVILLHQLIHENM